MKVKTGIHEINIGGLNLPMSFNILALDDFCMEQMISVSDLPGYLASPAGFLRLFAAMIRYGHKRKKMDCDLTDDDIADLVGMDMDVVIKGVGYFMPIESDPEKKSTPRKK